MKKIITALLIALIFIGCSSKSETRQAVEAQLIVGHNLESLKLNDQNGKTHSINADTKKIIFAFSKDVGHKCNKLFETKTDTYLKDNKAQFIADVSEAPSLIRKIFIMPGLKKFKYPILIIDDESISASYKPAINSEKIIVADVNNKIITNLTYFTTVSKLDEYIAN